MSFFAHKYDEHHITRENAMKTTNAISIVAVVMLAERQ